MGRSYRDLCDLIEKLAPMGRSYGGVAHAEHTRSTR